MSVAERLDETFDANRARRGYFADDDGSPYLSVAPRRAQITELLSPGFGFDQLPMVRENPRRRAPVRALLDRWLLGREGSARRALVDPDQLLAAELVRLTGLDPRWGFLQCTRPIAGGAELDHWVVGPGGVYLLNAKHLPGSKLHVRGDRFLVDGSEQPYVDEIRGEARRSAEQMSQHTRIDLGVTGVIVPVNDRRLVVEQFPLDVAVIDSMDVANWLVNRPEQFGKRQVLDAFEATKKNTLWVPRFAA